MTPTRSILTVATALAVALLALTSTAAQAALPAAKATITPGVGVGGLKLGGKARPYPRRWVKPTRCVSQGPMSGCAWTAKGRGAFPPSGTLGIAGPFLLALARDGRIGMITISAGDRDPAPRALRRYETRKGIGFDSTPDELASAYDVVRGRLADQWVLWGAGNATRTNFRFVDGRLRQIEIISCAVTGDCGRTPDMD